jgi:hypothetical protein
LSAAARIGLAVLSIGLIGVAVARFLRPVDFQSPLSLLTASLAIAGALLTPGWIASAWWGYNVFRPVTPCTEPLSAVFGHKRPDLDAAREREEVELSALRERAISDRRAVRELDRRLRRKIECAESDAAVARALLNGLETAEGWPKDAAAYMKVLEANILQWTAEREALRSRRGKQRA